MDSLGFTWTHLIHLQIHIYIYIYMYISMPTYLYSCSYYCFRQINLFRSRKTNIFSPRCWKQRFLSQFTKSHPKSKFSIPQIRKFSQKCEQFSYRGFLVLKGEKSRKWWSKIKYPEQHRRRSGGDLNNLYGLTTPSDQQ